MSEAICGLCPRHCRLGEGETGRCAARGNRGGRIALLNYGQVTSLALDPIEKKPLYHFHPRRPILSVGTFGCNLFCPFCQNYSIARAREGDLRTEAISPEALVELAARAREEYGNLGVAFTYNEPLVGYEYVLHAAKPLQEQGLAVVLVTNGQICEKPLAKLLPYVDALNIDLKGFTQDFYDWLGGDLEATKNAIAMAVAMGKHVEVTTLVIPSKNDSREEMAEEAHWLAGLSPELPLHLSRYFPRYQCDLPLTPRATLERLREVATKELRYVHLGNI